MTNHWVTQARIVDLSRIEGDKPLWTVTLAGVDEPITVTTAVLLSFRRFRNRVFRERSVWLEWLTAREWGLTVDSALGVFVRGEKP
jgi:hypothetical protein